MTTETAEPSPADGTIPSASSASASASPSPSPSANPTTDEKSVDADASLPADATGETTLGSSSSSKNNSNNSSNSDPEPIGKEDLIELIRAVKFKNPDFSQRQVYNEIVTEIPAKFPQYANSLSPETLGLNDVKKAWKKAILQQQQTPSASNSKSNNNNNNNNPNADLAARLKAMTINPQLYTIGLDGPNASSDDGNHTAAAARAYVARFLEDERAENSARERELLEDYVHVFLDVPADTSVATKPHQALINFQTKPAGTATVTAASKSGGGSSKKKKGGKKKAAAAAAAASDAAAAAAAAVAPFEDAIVVKIQMAARLDENDTAKHPMLLYDKTRTYKTFVHPSGALTGATDDTNNDNNNDNDNSNDDDGDDNTNTDGYSRLAHWIRNQGVRGALGTSGGTKAYFYGRLTQAKATKRILSIYVKKLVPPEGQDF
eukprot:CAMPEP_0172380454 /NCGR_PEP_ID=MMETSP1060-20121228/70437_1 /TAXON_ID=37318 /ORGANISM="Pseudo-nitzschia pungens, Strain cf. cingulata" /LENGTH=434 /DNA_ID=CAMNT_0013108207 /DNA_START=215 /DNA_END=1519 /DNA_ORIENTATION=+